jgi:hypothetical protein
VVAAERGELMNKKLGCQSSLRAALSLSRYANKEFLPATKLLSGARATDFSALVKKMIHADIKGTASY